MENKSARILRGAGVFFIAAIFCAGFSAIAYNEGNQFGYITGHDMGYTTGHDIGYIEGNQTGYVMGREDGIPKEFTSVAELREWLINDKTNDNRYVTTTYDCDDFAMSLVNAANEDGYIMYTFTETSFDWNIIQSYYTIYGVDYILLEDLEGVIASISGHAYNFVIIGGDIWFIEPQTDVIWYGGTEF